MGSSELTPTEFGFRPAAVSSETASSRSRPTTLGTTTFFGPVETVIVTKLPRSVRSPGCGSCAKTWPTGTSALSVRSTSSFSPASWICWTASRSTLPTTSGTATGFAALSCDCTSCQANQPPTSASATISDAEEPGPDRAAPRRLVVLVVAAGRVGRAQPPAAAGRIVVAASSVRESTVVAASAVSAETPIPRAIRSRSESISSAEW